MTLFSIYSIDYSVINNAAMIYQALNLDWLRTL